MLSRFDQNGVELIIDNETGEAFATIRGYSRMANKTQSTIQSRVDRLSEGERNSFMKTAEVLTSGGLQGVRLIPESLVAKWIVKDNPGLAQQMLLAGCRMFLYELAGYRVKVESPSVEPLKRDVQVEVLKMLFTINERSPDDRTTVTLKAHLTNLIEASQQSEPTPQLLSVTEVCELEGIYLPQGKDSVVGRKVAQAWRELHDGTDPQVCAKHVGTGHRAASIKVYPVEFFERIVAIAQEYLD